MKKGLFFVVMLAGVLAFGFAKANTWTVRNASAWTKAVNGIVKGGNGKTHTITVTGNVSIPTPYSEASTFGRVTGITVTITGSGTLSLSDKEIMGVAENGKTIIVKTTAGGGRYPPPRNGILLGIGNGQTVIAKDVTLKGLGATSITVK
jgi:hypothetical protein